MGLELLLKRYEFASERTHGSLFCGLKKLCDTLEDVVRTGEKVPGKTAIPTGRYEIRLTYSNRFEKIMPQLMNVPGFEGIRIHSGNTELDTDGCVLVGKRRGDRVLQSRDTYNNLLSFLQVALKRDLVFITIT